MAKAIRIQVPSIAEPVQKSPGFAKKLLCTHKLDLMGRCGFGCSYCSSTEGNYQRINRGAFADLALIQLGRRVAPVEMRDAEGNVTAEAEPNLTFEWGDVIEKLEAQLKGKPKSWGTGKVLVVSQLTDAFSPRAIAARKGTLSLTETALLMILERTSFKIRILTKSAVVGEPKWIAFFLRWPGRFLVGLSIGTLDDGWAQRIEIRTSSPSARVRAHRALQDAGVDVYAMLCPIFPDAAAHELLMQLLDAVRPERCVEVFAEAFNDRNNWEIVRDGYPVGSAGRAWFDDVYGAKKGSTRRTLWSHYASDLYINIATRAIRDGWIDQLRYLLYEGDIVVEDAPDYAGFRGVLLQGKRVQKADTDAEGNEIVIAKGPRKGQVRMVDTGWSTNHGIRKLQAYEGQGFVGYTDPRKAPGAAS